MSKVALDQIIDRFDNDFGYILPALWNGFQISCKNVGKNDQYGHYDPHHDNGVRYGEGKSEYVYREKIVWFHNIA